MEDDLDLLAGLLQALRKEGYAVDGAPDGEEGLYKAKATDYDAIVLDVLLPRLDGWKLLARLRALIRRRARQPRPAIELGEVRVDTATRTVTRADQEVTLTAREYVVLEFLALHRGEVITRTALYDHLFDEDDDTLSNILNVHVSNLRNKLGAELIHTRRGHGYLIP